MDIKFLSKIYVPNWLSYRQYNVKDCLKCFVSNELTHSFYEFDDISAQLLSVIMNMKDNEELISFIKNNELEDEIDDFIEELISYGIVSIKDQKSELKYNSLSLYTLEDHETTKEFEDNMYGWLRQHGFMSRLFIEMTYNCNLNCIHCYNCKDSKRTIKFEEIKPAIDEAYELGIFNVTVSGGECTLGEDFLKIIKYIREKRLSLDILTNGQLLYDNKELFEEVVNLYPYRVSLSLYSMNPEIHDSITGVKGSHHKTLSVINKLRERNVLVEIKCFLMEKNAYEYKPIQDYAKQIGVCMTLACLFFNNPERNNKEVDIKDDQLLHVYSDKDSLLKVSVSQNYKTDKDFFKRSVCSGGHKGLGIAPNLDIFVCSSLKILLGNLKTHSIKQLWKDTNIKSQLNCIRRTTKGDLDGCFKEEYCKYCLYCPGIAMFDGKYMQKYESFCRHAKIKMQAAKILGLEND